MFYLLPYPAHRAAPNHRCADRAEPRLAELLDLMTIGTIADVVPVDHNNRICVSAYSSRITPSR